MSNSLYNARYKALRKRLRLMRLAAELTQVQLAEKLDLGQSFVSKIERGENFIDVLLYARWCQTCGEKAGKVLDEVM